MATSGRYGLCAISVTCKQYSPIQGFHELAGL
jgi:hypothetical protein